jgi:hypothetical protein
LFDFIGSSETLSSESITAEKPPPAFLHIQPTGSSGDKDVMETWMLSHPGTGLSTGVTTPLAFPKRLLKATFLPEGLCLEGSVRAAKLYRLRTP